MPADNIKRVNICFPKDDDRILTMIDSIRGNQSRSQAIQRMLDYICASGPEVLRGVIAVRYQKEPQYVGDLDQTPQQ